MKRGFRYQTGEIDKVVKEINENKSALVDIDKEDEIEQVITDLTEYSPMFNDYEHNYIVGDMSDEKEFHSRITFADNTFIDFFLVDQPEETYDEIFWG